MLGSIATLSLKFWCSDTWKNAILPLWRNARSTSETFLVGYPSGSISGSQLLTNRWDFSALFSSTNSSSWKCWKTFIGETSTRQSKFGSGVRQPVRYWRSWYCRRNKIQQTFEQGKKRRGFQTVCWPENKMGSSYVRTQQNFWEEGCTADGQKSEIRRMIVASWVSQQLKIHLPPCRHRFPWTNTAKVSEHDWHSVVCFLFLSDFMWDSLMLYYTISHFQCVVECEITRSVNPSSI